MVYYEQTVRRGPGAASGVQARTGRKDSGAGVEVFLKVDLVSYSLNFYRGLYRGLL